MFAVNSVGGLAFVNNVIRSDADVHLDAMKNTRGDINEIRLLLRGNIETGYRLFREAVEKGDAVAQIQLSHALFGMKWGKDQEKDFSSLTASDLEGFCYYPKEFGLFNSVYDEAMGLNSDWETGQARGAEIFGLAANQEYLPAILELIHNKWKWNRDSYGFAAQLRPLVGQGDRQLDYYFGKALKNGCQIGSKIYYEGLYWMERSCGILVKYPERNQSFDSFISHYVQTEYYGHYYDYDGFRHIGSSIILAPSRQAWEAFVREKLRNINFIGLNHYLFPRNFERIIFLMNQCKIGAVYGNSFIEVPTMGSQILKYCEAKSHGFAIDTLTLYEDHKKIGNMSVRKDNFDIHQTIYYPKIYPIVEFIENVMKRSGSAISARSWLRQMGAQYI